MTIPERCGMPPLTCNTEGLRKHSFLLVFIKEDHINDVQRRWRAWLLHCLVAAARHYDKARQTILMQLDAKKSLSNASVFHIMDFAEHMEDCMASVFRACMCARKVASSADSFDAFCQNHKEAIDQLQKLRNQHEHMHTQIVSGEVGKGPIFLCLADEGDAMQFRDIRMPLASLHALIEGLYKSLVPLFPKFDGRSPPEPKGVLSLSISATTEMIRHEQD